MKELELKYFSVDNDPDEDDYNDLEPVVYSEEYTNGAIITYRVDDLMDEVYIDVLKVPEEERGKGYGTEIVKRLLNQYEYCEYDLNTYPSKVTWWERLGFKETSRDEHWVYMHRQAPMDDE